MAPCRPGQGGAEAAGGDRKVSAGFGAAPGKRRSSHLCVGWEGLGSRRIQNRMKGRTSMEINGELVNEEVRYADLGLSQALMQAIQYNLSSNKK